MRCHICDFNPDTPSPFYQGLSLNHSTKNKVTIHTDTGKPTCTECKDSSRTWAMNIGAVEGELELLDEVE